MVVQANFNHKSQLNLLQILPFFESDNTNSPIC